MIPILYRGDELKFLSNGLGRLSECISCTVTEERNGLYECEFVYPITGRFYEEMVTNGGIVGVIHDDQHDIQPFDIYAYTAPIDGKVTFYASHISYRLNQIPLTAFTASSCALALASIPGHSAVNNPFTFWTDKTASGTFTVDQPKSAREILVGSEGSILDVYGTGEYKFDKWAVKLYLHRGVDSDVTIRYGKNLTNIKREYDESNTFTAIAPFWTDGEVTVTLPEVYVQSQTPPTVEYPWQDENGNEITDENGNVIYFKATEVTPVPYDMSSFFEEEPTAADLRQAAVNYLANNSPWLPKDNITVDFVALWQTPEYENVAALQRVSLCDTVSVYFPALGVVKEKQEVVKVTYNVLLERYDQIELGTAKKTLLGVVAGEINALAEGTPTNAAMQVAIDHATELITGGLGGYVVIELNANGEPQELLIMDTPDKSTAVNVWRWNQGGLGHSHTGYAGPYSDIALTADGQINANMITSGAINANLITVGTMLADRILGGTLTLGGVNNTNGRWIVNDANGTEVARGDKDGVTSKALTATDYVYINGGAGSYFKIPLNDTYPAKEYMLLSANSNLPFLVRLCMFIGTLSETPYIVGIVGNTLQVKSEAAGGGYTEIAPSSITVGESGYAYYVKMIGGQVNIYDSNNSLQAKLGRNFMTNAPELQLGGTTLSENQLQQLLALI